MIRNLRLIRALELAAGALFFAGLVLFWPDPQPASSEDAASNEGQSALKTRARATDRVREPERTAMVEASSQSGQDREMEALHQFAERDFSAALAEAKRQYANLDWKRVQAGLASALLQKDFGRAPEILPLLESVVMQQVLMEVIPRVFRRDRGATATLVVDQLTGEARDYGGRYLARAQLNEGAMLAAMQTHLRMPSSRESGATASEIAGTITSANLGAGLDWLSQIESSDHRKTAHSQIVQNLGKAGDADGLMRLLAATPPEEPLKPDGSPGWGRDRLIIGIVRLRQLSGDQAGLEQLRGMVADDEKDYVEVGLLYADPNQSLEERFARATALKGMAYGTAVNAVIGKAVSDDPASAARFVIGLNDHRFVSAAMALIQRWKKKDAAGVEQWLRGLPPGQQREQAIELAVEVFKYGRPSEKELAREFVELAADAKQREKLRQWIKGFEPDSERAGGR